MAAIDELYRMRHILTDAELFKIQRIIQDAAKRVFFARTDLLSEAEKREQAAVLEEIRRVARLWGVTLDHSMTGAGRGGQAPEAVQPAVSLPAQRPQ